MQNQHATQAEKQPPRSVNSAWTIKRAKEIYSLPIPELVYRAQEIHREHQQKNAVQLCTLLSIKTGACPEDCAYCPQSAHHNTDLEKERLLDVEEVLNNARKAKENGASRFCMGAAWRNAPKHGDQFDKVLEMVKGVSELGMEACATLGMLTEEQADRLAQAGLTAYNHNLDSSKEFYGEVISTRKYEDRLETISRVSGAGISVCSGGIIGMGESIGDRIGMLVTLANLNPRPESVPINALVAVPGTPLENQKKVDPMDVVRMCATARIMMPKAIVRLSAGRESMSKEAQVLAFCAGANSIFYGEKLLTTPNPDTNDDLMMLDEAGLKPLIPPSCHTEHTPSNSSS